MAFTNNLFNSQPVFDSAMQIDSGGGEREQEITINARVEKHLQVLESQEMVWCMAEHVFLGKRVGPCGGGFFFHLVSELFKTN